MQNNDLKTVDKQETETLNYAIYLLVEDKIVKDIITLEEKEYEKHEKHDLLVVYQDDIDIELIDVESVKQMLKFGEVQLMWDGYLYESEQSVEDMLRQEIETLKQKIIQDNKKNEKTQFEMLQLIMDMM